MSNDDRSFIAGGVCGLFVAALTTMLIFVNVLACEYEYSDLLTPWVAP